MSNEITEQDFDFLRSRRLVRETGDLSKGDYEITSNPTLIKTLSKKFENLTNEDKEFLRIWRDKYRGESLKATSSFIQDESEVISKKVFPIDQENDIYWFGLLLPKEVDNEIKGKKLGRKQILSPCIITHGRELLEVSERIKEDYRIDFEETPSYLPRRWELSKLFNYLRGNTLRVDGRELLEKIKSQYEKYLFIRNKTWYKVHALWDIGTYLYVVFEAYPIFENRGIAGTSKTKGMTISSFMCFNGGQIMANPSEATLFRETEEVRGTKYIDEAEKLFQFNPKTKQFEGDVRAELLNASYTKEAKVPRQEKIGNKFITKWYSPYSPTQISSIIGLYGATETRAITKICTKSPNNDPRGELEPSEERNNPIWAEIRDECYRFALENWKQIKEIYNKFPKDCGLKRRDLQIWKPLLSIAKFISGEDYKEVLNFAIELSEMRLDDLISESSFDFMCLSALKECVLKNNQTDKHYLNSIKNKFCDQRGDEDSRKDIYLNRNIGTHLKRLGFEKRRDNQGNYIICDKTIFDEIVSPICPQLAILSTLSSLSTPLRVNDNENSEDSVKISEDEDKEEVSIVKISEDSVDGWKNKDKQKTSPLQKFIRKKKPLKPSDLTDKELETAGISREDLPDEKKM